MFKIKDLKDLAEKLGKPTLFDKLDDSVKKSLVNSINDLMIYSVNSEITYKDICIVMQCTMLATMDVTHDRVMDAIG